MYHCIEVSCCRYGSVLAVDSVQHSELQNSSATGGIDLISPLVLTTFVLPLSSAGTGWWAGNDAALDCGQ